jgi:DNA polymerase
MARAEETSALCVLHAAFDLIPLFSFRPYITPMSNGSVQRLVVQKLESLARAGVEQIGRVPPPAAIPAAAPIAPSIEHSAGPPPTAFPARFAPPQEERMPTSPAPLVAGGLLLRKPYPHGPASHAERQSALDAIRCQVESCKLCPVLVRNRTQTVFGVGTVQPRVVFFGEAPGADEDRQGEPFVGRAGQLLTKIIEACTWKRGDVYIMNTLKCRPPDNRTPEPDEVENCRPFWERQLEILRPEYIVCLGAVAAQALLETTESVGKLRGRFHGYRDSRVLVTYHPSYLLRNPSAKKLVWDDMKILLKEMGIPVRGASSASGGA